MGTGFAKRKKQAKALQQQVEHLQEKMAQTEATGTAGNGLVTITLNGDHELKRLKIDKQCVDPEDVEGLELLITSAYKDACEKLAANSQSGLGGLGGLGGFPGLGTLGF